MYQNLPTQSNEIPVPIQTKVTINKTNSIEMMTAT